MTFHILTLFPEAIAPYLAASIVGRAQADQLITVKLWNIRDFATDSHHTVDDSPYGGGAGMVMKIEPIDRTLDAVKSKIAGLSKTVVLSARGQQFTQQKAADYCALDSLILICGRYEGIDQRVADHLADEEISVGPYVLAGGELPALIITETVVRLIPGVLGNPESLKEESFSLEAAPREARSVGEERSGEYPHYTKPDNYNGWQVPEVLLSGNHQEIKKWRDKKRRKV